MKIKDFFSIFVSFACPACGIRRPDGEINICEECLAKLEFIHPPFCISCGGENDGVFDVCRHCLREGKRPWNAAISIFRMEGEARNLVHRFKYLNDTPLARTFASFAAMKLKLLDEKPDLISPVPLHWINCLIRGYNQSHLVSRFISEETGIPVVRTLKRSKWTRRQARLGHEQRRKNIISAFSVLDNAICKNRSILLVDDVFTTGATLSSATEALKAAGASRISVLTLARG